MKADFNNKKLDDLGVKFHFSRKLMHEVSSVYFFFLMSRAHTCRQREQPQCQITYVLYFFHLSSINGPVKRVKIIDNNFQPFYIEDIAVMHLNDEQVYT